MQSPHSPARDPYATTPPPTEARSLSEIAQLADDPPRYRPDFEVSFQRKGLLLWIVRVPDSKDLILTTLHPSRGSHAATAAEIASCMYYLHLHERPSPTKPIPAATLIRRSPGSSEEGGMGGGPAQKNVANLFSLAPMESGGGGEEIVVEMLGEGYAKFVNGAGVGRKPVPGTEQEMRQPFTRVMHVEGEGSRFWDRMKDGLKGRSSGNDDHHHHNRLQSHLSPHDPAFPHRAKKKKRDYVFDGLWASPTTGQSLGRCEFKDEAVGKYLKLKYYPRVEEEGGGGSTLLSVIEFKTSAVGGHKRSLSASDEDGSKMKAKLGMMIVHGPGQEMLDLLVAANLAAFLKRWDGWR